MKFTERLKNGHLTNDKLNKIMKAQYVVFYKYFGEENIRHYSFDVEIQSCASLTMNEIYCALRDYIGHGTRFTIISITKLD